MIFLPSQLKTFIEKLKSEHSEIKFTAVLVDPTEMANFVKENLQNFEIAVFGVIPDINSSSISVDSLKFQNTMGLRIVEKTAYSEVKHQAEWLEVYERTAALIKKIVTALVNEKAEQECCMDFKFLNLQSIRITPIWKEAHCNGWDVEFELDLK